MTKNSHTLIIPPGIDPTRLEAWVSPVPDKQGQELLSETIVGEAEHLARIDYVLQNNPLGVPGDIIELVKVRRPLGCGGQGAYGYDEPVGKRRNACVEVKQWMDFTAEEQRLYLQIYPGIQRVTDNDWYFITRLEAI